MFAYVFCFFLGAVLGLFASEFADRWGCSQRYRSSWQKKLFIVLLSGTGAAWLYWWEVENLMIYPSSRMSSSSIVLDDPIRCFIHLILFAILLAATLTDFYEMIIPDSIAVTGTLVALLAAFLFPSGVLLEPWFWNEEYNRTFASAIHVWSPNQIICPNPFGFFSSFEFFLLLMMTLLWWFWCFAMLDRVWYTKLPFRKANAIFWRYLYRSRRTKYIIAAALLVPVGFLFVTIESTTNFPVIRVATEQIALFSALVGMATGMVLIWSVRLVSRWVLGVEAMGFGDVTLMGMIGAFLGWQAVLVVFFAAPFFGLVYGIVNVALGKGRAVPYGPFLCLATVFVVIFWRYVWEATAEYFAFGIGTIGLFLLVMLVLFGGLLHVVHKIMSRLR